MRSRLVVSGLLLAALAGTLLSSCGGSSKDAESNAAAGSSAEIIRTPEYKQLLQIMAEEKLAADSAPYLTFDLPRRQLEIRVYGAVVRDLPVTVIGSDSTALQEFARRFGQSDSPIRRIERVYLFEGAKLVNDTVLGIVTEASKASPEMIQRYRPSRLAITWEGKLSMVVTTSVSGRPIPGNRNFLEATRSFVEQTFGGDEIQVQMDPDAAMSLYGICRSGLPTLLIQ